MQKTFKLDDSNYCLLLENALTPSEIESIWKPLLKVHSTKLGQPTTKTFGHRPKFLDMTFDIGQTGVPHRGYSHTEMVPSVANFAQLIREKFSHYQPNSYTKLYNSNLVHYTPAIGQGGGRGLHQDNPDIDLGMVLIYSWGQERQIKIVDAYESYTETLPSNSIFAMFGPDFQKMAKHMIKRLPASQKPGNRYSFNCRFMLAD